MIKPLFVCNCLIIISFNAICQQEIFFNLNGNGKDLITFSKENKIRSISSYLHFENGDSCLNVYWEFSKTGNPTTYMVYDCTDSITSLVEKCIYQYNEQDSLILKEIYTQQNHFTNNKVINCMHLSTRFSYKYLT